ISLDLLCFPTRRSSDLYSLVLQGAIGDVFFHRRALTMDFLGPLFQVVMIDLVLAGDNAVVIGLAASGLPREQRAKAILVGIIARSEEHTSELQLREKLV